MLVMIPGITTGGMLSVGQHSYWCRCGNILEGADFLQPDAYSVVLDVCGSISALVFQLPLEQRTCGCTAMALTMKQVLIVLGQKKLHIYSSCL